MSCDCSPHGLRPAKDFQQSKFVVKHTFLEEQASTTPRQTRCWSDAELEYGEYADKFAPLDKDDANSDDALSTAAASTSLGSISASEDVDDGSVLGFPPGDLKSPQFPCVPVMAWQLLQSETFVSCNLDAMLSARKAALGDTVSELANAALQAERMSVPMEASNQNQVAEKTTIILRNLPTEYTRAKLLEWLDAEGFGGQYDFLYMPVNFETDMCFGYSFINLVSHSSACRALERFGGQIIPGVSDAECGAAWSEPYQGFATYVERYRNSPVMHKSVPDEHRPVLFASGIRYPFPAPTRRLKTPRARKTWRG